MHIAPSIRQREVILIGCYRTTIKFQHNGSYQFNSFRNVSLSDVTSTAFLSMNEDDEFDEVAVT
jgi:hypothetical protein